MPLPRHLPHILYALAITSVSLHLLDKKKTAADQRFQALAKIGVLESVVTRLRSRENVTDMEIERLLTMVGERKRDGEVAGRDGLPRERNVNWKEVLLGRAPVGNSSDEPKGVGEALRAPETVSQTPSSL